MNKEQYINKIAQTYKDCLHIVDIKCADYAQDHDPFANFRTSEVVGVPLDRAILVRMMDKMSRISNLISREAQVKDESIFDTLSDLINYTAILKTYLEEVRKNVDNKMADN
jgi:hypothetical protein